jgi:heme-degrading monooxygenase HmoA
MFTVLFEVHPRADRMDDYLAHAKQLRPELEKIDGFVENVRYRSLTRAGCILSRSDWRDEKALVRWRTQALHHEVQVRGRTQVFADYRLRVGEITRDSGLAEGTSLDGHRFDETASGATAVTLVEARRAAAHVTGAAPEALAGELGLVPAAPGLVGWDVFDAVLAAGDVLLMLAWRDAAAAEAFEAAQRTPADARVRRVRVVRDYGMFDRREAPQYYPDSARRMDCSDPAF